MPVGFLVCFVTALNAFSGKVDGAMAYQCGPSRLRSELVSVDSKLLSSGH